MTALPGSSRTLRATFAEIDRQPGNLTEVLALVTSALLTGRRHLICQDPYRIHHRNRDIERTTDHRQFGAGQHQHFGPALGEFVGCSRQDGKRARKHTAALWSRPPWLRQRCE